NDHDAVLLVIILRQFNLPIEDSQHIFSFQLLWLRVGTMALQTERAALRPEQLGTVAAVGLVTGCASLRKRRLVMNRLLLQLGQVGVAGQAGVNGIGLDESRSLPGVRIVASGAIALRPGMLHLGFFDFFRLLTVAREAYGFGISLRQNDLTVPRCGVAGVALSTRKGWMRVGLHQLRLGRLMRVVTLHAIRRSERLPLVRLDQVRGRRIVTVET